MPWALAGAAVSAGAGLIGGAMQSSAAKSGQDAAIAAQQQQQAQTRSDLMPWMTAGTNALMPTADLAGANGPDAAAAAMKNFYTSPGYQWRLEQGLRGVDAGAAARGMLRSGATLQGEQAFGEGLAASEFSNYYSRLNDLSKLGENAAAGVGQAGTDAARGIAAANIGGANAQSSIYGNTASGMAGSINGLLSNKDFQSWIGGGTASNLTNTQLAASNPAALGWRV